MESNNTNHRPDNVVSNTQNKYTVSTTQLKTAFHYLQNHTATASMVAESTGIPQKSICRYKRFRKTWFTLRSEKDCVN